MKWYKDVFDIVFEGIDQTKANNLWKAQLKKKPKTAPQEIESLEVDMEEKEKDDDDRIIGRGSRKEVETTKEGGWWGRWF